MKTIGYGGAILALLAAQGCQTPRAAFDARLLGCWEGESTTLARAGAAPATLPSRCTVTYTRDRAVSVCGAPDGSDPAAGGARIESAYTIASPGVLTSVVVAHDRLPELIGATNRVVYRFEGDALITRIDAADARPAQGVQDPAADMRNLSRRKRAGPSAPGAATCADPPRARE